MIRARFLLTSSAAAAAACLACSAPVPDQVLPDVPAQASAAPAPGLLLTATLDHTRLGPGSTVGLGVQLRNTGSSPVSISADGPCNPALLIHVQDGAGRTVWAEPVPMCAQIVPPASPALAPGQAVNANRCFSLEAAARNGCSILALPAGTYTLAGSFHALALPGLQIKVAEHQTTTNVGGGPRGIPTAAPAVNTSAVPPRSVPAGEIPPADRSRP